MISAVFRSRFLYDIQGNKRFVMKRDMQESEISQTVVRLSPSLMDINCDPTDAGFRQIPGRLFKHAIASRDSVSRRVDLMARGQESSKRNQQCVQGRANKRPRLNIESSSKRSATADDRPCGGEGQLIGLEMLAMAPETGQSNPDRDRPVKSIGGHGEKHTAPMFK
jgi:hypothetical protein